MTIIMNIYECTLPCLKPRQHAGSPELTFALWPPTIVEFGPILGLICRSFVTRDDFLALQCDCVPRLDEAWLF